MYGYCGTWYCFKSPRVLVPTKLRQFAAINRFGAPNLESKKASMSAFKRKAQAAFSGRLIVPKKSRRDRPPPQVLMAEAAARQFMRRRSRNVRTAGFLGIEKKFYDTALAATAFSAATDATGGEYDPSATSMISTPAVGDGEQNRDGKQIVCKYVEIKGEVIEPAATNQTSGTGPRMAMLALVLDTQSNAAQAQSETVFKNLAASANMAPLALRNLEYGTRFRLLKQQYFDFPVGANMVYDGTNIETNAAIKRFHWFVPLKDLKINFNSGTTSSIANVVDNSLHIMGFASSASMTVSYNARLRFIG